VFEIVLEIWNFTVLCKFCLQNRLKTIRGYDYLWCQWIILLDWVDKDNIFHAIVVNNNIDALSKSIISKIVLAIDPYFELPECVSTDSGCILIYLVSLIYWLNKYWTLLNRHSPYGRYCVYKLMLSRATCYKLTSEAVKCENIVRLITFVVNNWLDSLVKEAVRRIDLSSLTKNINSDLGTCKLEGSFKIC